MPPTILLADDHAVVRQGLRALLEREGFPVVGEAGDGSEAVRLAETLRPDVAVLDLSMPQLNGVEATRQILKASPKTRTVLLTMHAEEQYVLPALQAGIAGYVLKTRAAADLLEAIREVSQSRTYLSPGVAGAVARAYCDRTAPPADPLTPRERQVLQLVAEGKSTKQAAAILGISVKTADSHRTRLMEKLDIHDTAGLVRYAIRRGLIQP